MNNIDKVFSSGKAFIAYITAGDPSLEITEQMIYTLAENGADLIEIGIPFSDPVAEGEVIQLASERALLAGTTTDKVFEMIKKVREKCDVPLAIMTYANIVFKYPTEEFMKKCSENSVCAVIIPDLPFEEKAEISACCEKNDVKQISLIAPTSHERISLIAKEAEGFIYCVSSMGVTGVRSEIKTDISQMIAQIKAENNIPCAVGFGISSPDQAAEIARYADGVIVGSAIVKIIAEHGENSAPFVADFAAKIKQAIDSCK